MKGIVASKGISISKCYILSEPNLEFKTTTINDVDKEIKRLQDAIDKSIIDIDNLIVKTKEKLGEDKAQIFEAHKMIGSDPEMIKQVNEIITNEKVNAEKALNDVITMYINMFESMDDEYMRERAADLKDVSKRFMAKLLNIKLSSPSEIDEEVIVIAYDLTPSDTAQLDRNLVQGFATEIGGRTSHSAIMARSLEIPATVGVKGLLSNVKDGDKIILDSINGEIIVNPSSDVVKKYETMKKEYLAKVEKLNTLKDSETITKDGHQVMIYSNIGKPDDADAAISYGAEGIGLFRSEFLYMDRPDFPTEDEQFEAYKSVLQKMNGREVIIRTLDIGGDKELDYLKLPHEMNPFLGYRAIRLCLDRTDIFKTQLRALLRASTFGHLGIMFPMIATIDEFRKAKEILLETKKELIKEGIKVSDDLKLGIMVEIPATAVLADQFAKEVDFFSIGTNDLMQYTFAADRMNEEVSYLYQPLNPSILRLIKMTIDAAEKEGKFVGMCGEMASDENAIPILLGLGLHEFSMSSTSVLESRDKIINLSFKECKQLAEKVLNCSNQEEVYKKLEEMK